LDKFVKKLAQENAELRFAYKAGPWRFVLCRHLRHKAITCEVIAPCLIPKKASDRVKTDRRDADPLARLFRAGELTAIRVPDQEDEAIRDLVLGLQDIAAGVSMIRAAQVCQPSAARCAR